MFQCFQHIIELPDAGRLSRERHVRGVYLYGFDNIESHLEQSRAPAARPRTMASALFRASFVSVPADTVPMRMPSARDTI